MPPSGMLYVVFCANIFFLLSIRQGYNFSTTYFPFSDSEPFFRAQLFKRSDVDYGDDDAMLSEGVPVSVRGVDKAPPPPLPNANHFQGSGDSLSGIVVFICPSICSASKCFQRLSLDVCWSCVT